MRALERLSARWFGRGPGGRVFRHRFAWLLLAAALPLALFGLATQIGASDRQAEALALARVQASRALADSLFERLLAARELLQAQVGEAIAHGGTQARASSVLVEIEHLAWPAAAPAAVTPTSVAPAGGAVKPVVMAGIADSPPGGMSAGGLVRVAGSGPASLSAWWRSLAPSQARVPAAGRSRLVLRPPSRSGERAEVVLVSSIGAGLWLARVDPLYLWPSPGDARGLATCVRSVGGLAIDCAAPGETRAAASAAMPAGAARLVMQPEFDADDWTVWRDVPGAAFAAEATRSGVFGALVALLAVGVAAVAAVLQTRATVEPMAQLLDGARRLAEDDLGARVAVPAHAELGELASHFNTMASELESRFGAMRGLSAIDREVLGGSGLAAAMPHVLTQLAAAWPGAGVAVVVADLDLLSGGAGAGGAARLTLHRRCLDAARDELDRPLVPAEGVFLPPEGSPASGQVPVGAPLLFDAVAQPPQPGWCWWMPVRLRQREVAVLLAWSADPPAHPAAAHASGLRLQALRDHVGLMLAAHERDHVLLRRARQDALTGLLNRSGFEEALEALGRRRSSAFALLAIDLLDDASTRDVPSAAVHDELLAMSARRLRDTLPEGAIACRAEGRARFQVVLPRGDSAAAPFDRTVQALMEALGRPCELGQVSVVPGVVIGIAMSPEDGSLRTELQARAHLALRAARRDGAGTRRRFEPALEASALKAAGLRADLQRAFDTGAFELRWQPRVDARSGCAVSAEALMRWRHPQRGLLSPAEFMAVASTSGLAVPIGAWVLASACRQLVAWRQAGIELDRVSVNVSPRHLQEPDFDQTVLAQVDAAGLQPADLELEFGEAVMALDDAGLRRRVARLREAGVRIALDDFGNGLAPLASLRELPVDAIKLDASLVQSVESEPTARAMVQAIAGLAHSLGLRLVAEGIESVAMAERMRALPCAELQGYAFSAPVDAGAFIRLPCVVGGTAPRSASAA